MSVIKIVHKIKFQYIAIYGIYSKYSKHAFLENGVSDRFGVFS